MNMMSDDSLSHHGIKGQQWGVMHGPPYPLDKDQSIRIKKGATLDHVSTDKKIKLGDRGVYAYDASDAWDKTVYQGAYSEFLRYSRGGKIYNHTFTVNEDLVLPSQKEKVDTFLQIYKKDKDLQKNITDYIKSIEPDEDGQYQIEDSIASNRESIMRAWDDLDKDEQTRLNREYRIFMNYFNVSSNDSWKKASDKFINALKDKGYNAVIDDNNAVLYNGAHSPVYVFEGNLLSEKKHAKEVKKKIIITNQEEIRSKRGTIVYSGI